MAESTISTPPQTTLSVASPSEPKVAPEVSLERLDSLLETYLELLDGYTTLRTQLSKQFSDGFFSLARANHTSPTLGSGRRYGEEGYDERMKAHRRIVYSTRDSQRDENWSTTEDGKVGTPVRSQRLELSNLKADTSPAYRISIQTIRAPLDSPKSSSSDETDTSKHRAADAALQNDEPTSSPFANGPPTTTKPASPSSTKTKPTPSNRDPLNWYGILIPPPLRQAQASFISAVESSVPQLLNTSASMHDLETRITKLRIELGLQPGPDADQNIDESTSAQGEDISTISPNSQPSKPTKDVARISTSPRKHLAQRPEPRPRILKLDS
jgi:coiled-coil domain-containing protein 115